jgi:hypothetical protein
MASYMLMFCTTMKMIPSLLSRLLAPAFAAGLMIVPAASLHANIVAVPDVGGLQAFEDTNTGLTWLALDNFFNQTPDQEIVTAATAGFTVADASQVETLLDSLPLTGGQWTADAAIMGSAPNRGLIWGDFADSSNPNNQEWAYAYSTDTAWTFEGDGFSLGSTEFTNGQVPNGGTTDADLNLWAIETGTQSVGSSVPDGFPTVLMLGVSILMLAGLRWRFGAASAR